MAKKGHMELDSLLLHSLDLIRDIIEEALRVDRLPAWKEQNEN